MSIENLPAVSIIIPAYNEESYIKQTLVALGGSDYPSELLEIIVVDNGSSDNTVAIAQEFSDKVLSLKEGNVGAVRNMGAQYAAADILIFIDADCIVDSGWITRGAKCLRSEKDTVFGGAYKTSPQANWIEKLWLLENPKKTRLQPDLLGGCIFISSDIFNRLGGFNERMTSGEDSDLSMRLRNMGLTVKIANNLSVIHLGNPSTLKYFFLRQVWHSENYLAFMKSSVKDYTFWMTILFISTIFASIYSIILNNQNSDTLAIFSITAILASTLSLKRIILTRYILKSPQELLGIFVLDYTYLAARSIGVIKSMRKIIKNH